MVEAVGILRSSVGRIWAGAGLKPHLAKGLKVSNDLMFEGKVTEIVCLYLDPPDRAVVLCVDERSQIQALDRTQPSPLLKKGKAATLTQDYKRYSSTTLFAAPGLKSGLVIGDCSPRHRAKEFLSSLCRIDRAVKKFRGSTWFSKTTLATRRRRCRLGWPSTFQAVLQAYQITPKSAGFSDVPMVEGLKFFPGNKIALHPARPLGPCQ